MFEINRPDQPAIQIQSFFKVMRNTRLTLPTADYQKLQEHLEECANAARPSSKLLTYVLANKLMNTRPADDLHHWECVVGGCCVTYAIDAEDPQTGLLVHRARAGSVSGVIPVASLLGATLIGMRIGQRAPLLFENGAISRLCVIDVTRSV